MSTSKRELLAALLDRREARHKRIAANEAKRKAKRKVGIGARPIADGSDNDFALPGWSPSFQGVTAQPVGASLGNGAYRR